MTERIQIDSYSKWCLSSGTSSRAKGKSTGGSDVKELTPILTVHLVDLELEFRMLQEV